MQFSCEGRRVNIIEQISTHYDIFGIILLEDDTGAKMNVIEDQYRGAGASMINRQILTKWLEGSGKTPVNWATLADVLEECGLTEISGYIRREKSK